MKYDESTEQYSMTHKLYLGAYCMYIHLPSILPFLGTLGPQGARKRILPVKQNSYSQKEVISPFTCF